MMRSSALSLGWARRFVSALVLLSLMGTTLRIIGGRFARPTAAQDGANTVNVELILDLSGSMGATLPGTNETRMDAARRVMTDVIAALPVREGVNVGFRIYGHEGSNRNEDREESCQSSDLVVPIEGVDKQALQEQVNAARPVGWTPLALSLQRGGEDFADRTGEGISNNIVMVTDGEETCGGDPCAVATSLRQGEAAVTTHVVGFALTPEQQQQVNCIAENGGGLNLSAANANELSAQLFTILQEIQVVVENGFLEIEEFGGLFPRATVTGQPRGDQIEGQTFTFTDSNRMELAVGIYTVSWSYETGEQKTITVNIEAGRTTWIRGSLLKFPQGQGEIYEVRDLEGVAVWRAPFEQGDYVWVLPGIYTMELVERVGDPILVMAQVQTLPGTATQVEVFTVGS